jgi:membrane dipeptidase
MPAEVDHASAAAAEISEHARRLHDSSVIIDACCPGEYWVKNFPKWLDGGASCTVFTIAATQSCRDTMALIAKFYKFYNLSQQYDGPLVLATTTDDIRAAKANGKLAVVLQFQGTHPIEYDPSLVELYWRLGVRVIQLAYNQRSPVGDGCEEPDNAGLSELGYQVVGELNRLGVAVDLSHTGVRASFEAVEASTAPCIVSHANAKAVHDCKRNLSDDLIRAVVEKGGVIGLNGFPAFVSDKESPTLDNLIDHLVHFDTIAGESGHVGLGLDYYHATQSEYDENIGQGTWHPDSYPPPPWNFPAGIDDPTTLNRLTDRLVQRGYSDDQIRGVLGENWMRVFNQIWSKG